MITTQMTQSDNALPSSVTRPTSSVPIPSRAISSWPLTCLFITFIISILTVTATTIPYNFNPAPLTIGLEKLGVGLLVGPEDIAYVSSSEVTVENWVNTGGRPLGLAFGRHNEVIVADVEQGLLNISRYNKKVVLTDEEEDVKFRLTDSVDITKDGMVYFVDASYKYRLSEFTLEILEGNPHGKLLSYDLRTRRTRVLVPELYFANGVAVSKDQYSWSSVRQSCTFIHDSTLLLK
ncbi:hypothetical protein FNV43_RR18669 [Rhamnella rubrinervis]|uniref:Strictosidine synthase conserved region domain-containing protein n=1 Tax=Rhamnella rubrinervis TaxID=2594499 RepID=A0A8K0E6Q8_9ROSA|nr:hypothetical protein FNV43_RR18669 [Rhamnella rubrinervis]